MRYPFNEGPARQAVPLVLLLTLVLAVSPAAVPAGELMTVPEPTEVVDEPTLVFFTNGRGLRVQGYRVEGDWVYLIVSKRSDPEEEPSEIGVPLDRIASLQVDSAAKKAYANVPLNKRGYVANGAVANQVQQGVVEERVGAAIPHVPAAGSDEARKYRPRSTAPDIGPTDAVAGARFYEPLRNLRVPERVKSQARHWAELRKRDPEAWRQAIEESGTLERLVPQTAPLEDDPTSDPKPASDDAAEEPPAGGESAAAGNNDSDEPDS